MDTPKDTTTDRRSESEGTSIVVSPSLAKEFVIVGDDEAAVMVGVVVGAMDGREDGMCSGTVKL